MRILYSLPHPSHTLASEDAGHMVRARALLDALEEAGHSVCRVEAAATSPAARAVGAYRGARGRVPRPVAVAVRDVGRVRFGRRHARVLTRAAASFRPDVLLETHVAFSLAGALASARAGVPLVLDDVSPPWEEAREGRGGLQWLAHAVHRRALRAAARAVVPNEVLRAALVAAGADPDRLAVVGNGVLAAGPRPGARAATRAALGIPAGAPVAVFAGSIQPFQQADRLVDAFAAAAAPGAHLLVVGGRPERVALLRDRAAGASAGDRVHFTGRVPHAAVADHLAAADVGVVPATNDYGQPMKLLEYLAAGLPVVAPRQPTVTEVVGDDAESRGVTLFRAGDTAALAGALREVLAGPDRRAALARAAERACPVPSWEEQAARLAAELERVVR